MDSSNKEKKDTLDDLNLDDLGDLQMESDIEKSDQLYELEVEPSDNKSNGMAQEQFRSPTGQQPGPVRAPATANGTPSSSVNTQAAGAPLNMQGKPLPGPLPKPIKTKNAGDIIISAFKLLTAVIIFGVIPASAYFYYFLPLKLEKKFMPDIETYSNPEIDTKEKLTEDGEQPFRTGKLLIVSPELKITLTDVKTGQPHTITDHAKLHRIFFKLSGKLRADNPDEIDTLIVLKRTNGEIRRFGDRKTEVVTSNKIHMDVFAWKDNLYIGNWLFDPGEFQDDMTDAEYQAMKDAASDETILKFIESMPFEELVEDN